MTEEQKTAQISVAEETAAAQSDEYAGGGQEKVGSSQGESAKEVSEAEFSGQESAKGVEAKEQGKEKDASKSRENAENARRRREEERQRELRKARDDAVLLALGSKNPYTGEEMKDSSDVEEFLTMQKIEKSGGDPVADFHKFVKNDRRAKEQKEREKSGRQEWFKKDKEDFQTKHPDCDLNALLEDEHFVHFAQGKVGEMPLSEIYEGYVALVEELVKKADRAAAQKVANAKASPGALSGGTSEEDGFFTKEQVKSMSKADIHRNYEKIRESMKKWS